jgi:hypothetical protein
MSIKNKVTGELSNITTYGANGRISDIMCQAMLLPVRMLVRIH